jgi:hypothetical protein
MGYIERFAKCIIVYLYTFLYSQHILCFRLNCSYLNISLCFVETDSVSITSSRSNTGSNVLYSSHGLGDSKSSLNSGHLYGGQLSATESGLEDDRHDDSETDSAGSE